MQFPLTRALKLTARSDHYHHKHATLLFKGSVVVAAGYNQGDKHSEIMALNKIKHKIKTKGLIAFNVRMTKGGAVGIAAPCKDCTAAFKHAGISAVWFTLDTWGLGVIKYEN